MSKPIYEIWIGAKLDLKKLQKDVNAAKKSIEKINPKIEIKARDKISSVVKKVDNEVKKATKSTKELSDSFVGVGIAGAAALTGIIASVKKGVDEFVKFNSAISGLKSQMEYVGEDFSKALNVMKETTSDGLITESDVAQSIKNLTLYGYSLKEATELISRLKDSAAYNRQAHYSLSEAVKVTIEGIRMENSILLDAA